MAGMAVGEGAIDRQCQTSRLTTGRLASNEIKVAYIDGLDFETIEDGKGRGQSSSGDDYIIVSPA
jgi:hypothetical protein